MTGWKLTDKQWEALDDLRFSTADKALFRNAAIIITSAAGRSKPSIAHDLGCSVGTVDVVRRRYREQGLAGLAKAKPPGRKSRATPAYRAALRTVVETPPQSLALRLQRRVAGSALADLTLVYVAGRDDIETVFSLDRRDLTVYRDRRRRPFKLIS